MILLLTVGAAFLIGMVFEIVTGYALKLRSSGELIDRDKEGGEFWVTIAIHIAVGLFCIGMALAQTLSLWP